ncbi:disease resistance protein RUN1-like [Eucalyptus grandis]|uniref:disease resistance protein RUN1-like n=1 Tax=Eucalyptus grandis TaxID=71139 RepID=UPI00192ED5B4|nr:disease resistance protein RUN1-like [Eucalyptus grandis]
MMVAASFQTSESSQTDKDIIRMQNKLLSDILRKPIDVHDIDDGIDMITERFRSKKVLIVLDDIDKLEQLTKLKGNSGWLGPGSRVIVTTRNVDLLPFLSKEYYAYEMMEMNTCHALQLFSKHAFGETLPPDDRETLSNEIVATTRRIPLALEASGSFLRGKSPEVWAETLERLRKVPDRRVQETLRISYEALSFEEKQIYLDIACFFNGMESTSAIYVWKSCGYFPVSGLATLTGMSLLKIDHRNILQMHDLIRDLGREIVREENYLNAGSRSRLWESEECLCVLREQVDYQRKSNVESLRLRFSEAQMLTSQEFASVPNLRLLSLDRGNFTGDFKGLLSLLKWLSLRNCPAHFRVTNFSPRNLAVLKLSNSELRDDWPGWHQFMKAPQLKVLELEECSHLTRLPDLSSLSTLERLTIRKCHNLVDIGESIGKLVHLNYMEINACKRLKALPEEVDCLKASKGLIVMVVILGPVGSYLPQLIGDQQSLTRLEMESVRISELPDSIGKLESLLELDLSCTKVTKLPNSIGNLRKLKELAMGRARISKLPHSIGELKNLKGLHLSGCDELRELPDSIGKLQSLLELDLSCTKVTELPDSIGNLKKLKELVMINVRISKLPHSIGELKDLKSLRLSRCDELRELPDSIGKLESLLELDSSCTMVTELPDSIENLKKLKELVMENVRISKLPHSIGELKGLERLRLSSCKELRELPDSIGGLESLLELDLSYTKVTELPDSIGRLRKLKVIWISHSEIKRIPGTVGMVEKLEEFHAEHCVNLKGKIPSGIGSLSSLKILNLSHTCIRSVPTTINQLSHLQELCLEGCHKLKQIPELPASLIILSVECRLLKTVPNLSNLANLVNLTISNYSGESHSNPWVADSIQTPNLEWVGRLLRLEKLKLVHKSIIVPPTELAPFPHLAQPGLSCFDLQSLPQPLPSALSTLKLINFNSLAKLSPCADLKNLSSLELCKSWLTEIPLNWFGHSENLRELTMSNCTNLRKLSCLSGLKKLRAVCLLNCPRLVEIQDLEELELLESIRIDQCSSLVRLPSLLKLKKLRTMEFISCRSLVSLPFLSRVASEDCHLVVDGCDKLANHNGPCQLHRYERQCPNPIRAYEPGDRQHSPWPVSI